MTKFYETLKITYSKKLFSKSFLFTTGILILIIVGISNYDKIVKIFNDEPKIVSVITENSEILPYLNENKILIDKNMKFIKGNDTSTAMKLLKSEDIDEIYEITESKNSTLSIKIHTINSFNQSELQVLENLFTNFQLAIIQQNLKLESKDLQLLNSKSDISINQLNSMDLSAKYSDQENSFLILFAYVIIIMMIFIIINYSNQIALEIAAEKTSRVIEMVITSMSPSAHLIAKILAIILVALTQLAILFITIILCKNTVDYTEIFDALGVKFNDNFWPIIIIGIILFVLGIISYIVLAAILGSLTSRIEDLTQSLIPVSILALSSFYISFLNIDNSESLLVRVTSFIPFLSPFNLLVRLINQNVTNIEITIILLINILAIIIMIIIATFTYKNSVLSFEKSILKTLKRRV